MQLSIEGKLEVLFMVLKLVFFFFSNFLPFPLLACYYRMKIFNKYNLTNKGITKLGYKSNPLTCGF